MRIKDAYAEVRYRPRDGTDLASALAAEIIRYSDARAEDPTLLFSAIGPLVHEPALTEAHRVHG